jgi:hypothetical protein
MTNNNDFARHACSQRRRAAYWLNRDPIGLAGGLNLYAYVGNRPIDHVDPMGLTMDGTSSPYSAATLLHKSDRSYGPDPEGTAVLFKVYEGAGAALVLTLAPEAVALYGPEILAAGNAVAKSPIAIKSAAVFAATLTLAEGPFQEQTEGLGESLQYLNEGLAETGLAEFPTIQQLNGALATEYQWIRDEVDSVALASKLNTPGPNSNNNSLANNPSALPGSKCP